jgi:Peptidase family M23
MPVDAKIGGSGGTARVAAVVLALLAIASCSSEPDPAGTGGAGGAPATTGTTTSASGGGEGGSGAAGGSGEGGAGGAAAPEDPCTGVADGAHCGADLGGLADHGSLYTCAAGVTESATPCPGGCEGGACNVVGPDPCSSATSGNGLYCGGSLTGGDPQKLYDCQNGATASEQVCVAGCQVNPPGVADNCKPEGDPCVNAVSGDGLYCGGSLGGGDPNVLYSCVGMATASSVVCAAGCQINPPGEADACAPVGGGSCCVEEPPGVITQTYSACGGGGSHYGMDYGTAIGTPIYAGISGTVVASVLGFPNCYDSGCTPDCWNAFNYVKLKSDCGDPDDPAKDFFIYYLHIDSLGPGIANGAHVDQGQLLANSGNSGCSSGPHIHIETVSVPAGSGGVLQQCSSVNPASRYCP